MTKFGSKGSISNEDFMICILNLPEEHYVILDGLENCLSSSGTNALTIKIIQLNLNHQYKKIKGKKKEK